MTKRVTAGILILLLAVGFAFYSEWAISDAVKTLEGALESEDGEVFVRRYEEKKTTLRLLLADTVISELDAASEKILSSEAAERKEGKEETAAILLRIREENCFSFVKIL